MTQQFYCIRNFSSLKAKEDFVILIIKKKNENYQFINKHLVQLEKFYKIII